MDVRGQRVLIFGDSLTQRGSTELVNVTEPPNRASSAPGDLLASWLLAGGAAAARLDARSGRSAINFWDREATTQLLQSDAQWKPTLVVVMLGTNDIGRDLARTTAAMARIRDAYQSMGARVIAIGPPSFTRADLQQGSQPVVALLQTVFGKRNVIDARPLSADLAGAKFRKSDQVHFTRDGAAVLAQRLVGAIAQLGGVREKLAKLKPLGIGLGATLGVGLIGFGLLWISKRRTKLLAGGLRGDEPLFNAEEFFSYLPDPPEDVEDAFGWKEPDEDDWKDAYAAKGSRYRTRWLADEGHMVWLTWDQVHAMQGNQFEGEKVAALVEAIKRGGATLEPPIASLSIVTKDDVRESQEAAKRDELFDSYGTTRPYEEDDIGKITVQLRDGNHRAFAAQIAGERGLWAYVPDSKMDDAKAVLKKLKKAQKVKLEGAKTTGDKKRDARRRAKAIKEGKLATVCPVCGEEVEDAATHESSPWHIANLGMTKQERHHEIEEERANPVVDVTSRAIAPFLGATRIGYKVMRYDPKTKSAVSGANSRLRLPLRRGAEVTMPGAGIFMSLDERYVQEHYSNHDQNVLMTFEFDPSTVTTGNLTDRETEFTVPKAKLIAFRVYGDTDLAGVQPYDSESFSERLREAKESPKLFKATAERVAETAKAIAREGNAWGGRKVFISDIAKRLGVPTKSIAGPLLIANNRGWLELSRADLTAAMDEGKVRASEIEMPDGLARYHFVVVG